MANIGSIKFDVVLRTKDGETEHVVGELEIPISIDTPKGGKVMRLHTDDIPRRLREVLA